MNTIDFILLAVIAAAFITAVVFCIRRKKQGMGCCGGCENCSAACRRNEQRK